MILSPSRYAVGSPKLIENGELNACWDLASGSVYIVVVLIPYRAAVLPTRLFLMSLKFLEIH